jgi:proton-dependent oligopeptide transporter, POT family
MTERASDSVETATAPPKSKSGIDASALLDVKQLGLFAAIASLGYVFWIVGAMEMVERLAYYGVKAVATLYAKDPVSKGGLGVGMDKFGTILAVWAFTQSFVPVVTGGLSDRYGYKETIFASTLVKISGYVVMGLFPTFGGFFAGAVLLATGTAIFKPGIQGTLVKSTRRDNSSVAWAIFYQTVNIGGFLGPLVAGLLRKLEWRFVFFACAGIICFNFLLLFTYQEIGKEERLARLRQGSQPNLLVDSFRELIKPHVWSYLLIFSGFWFMFNSLFDVLPAHLEDWVDTRGIVRSLFGDHGSSNKIVNFFVVVSKDGKEIQPEGILNLNAGLIMVTCFLFGALSSKMRATTSMVVGTLLAAFALFVSGYSRFGWISVLAIGCFSIGEMLSSPKFNEFIGNFAPADKKAMYLGFSQFSLALGWTIEGKVGPVLYERLASKEVFARQMLAEKGWTAEALKQLPTGEGFNKLVAIMGTDKWSVTELLYQRHHATIGLVWYIMGAVGLASAVGIAWYGRWIRRSAAAQT